jgi:hypothetical protein
MISSEESTRQGRGDSMFPILSNSRFLDDDGDDDDDEDKRASRFLRDFSYKKKKKRKQKKKMSKGIIYSVSIEKIKMRIIIKEKLGDIQKVLCV